MPSSVRGSRALPSPGSLDWARSVKKQLEQSFAEEIAPITLVETAVQHYPGDSFVQSLNHAPLRVLGSMMASRTPTMLRMALLSREVAPLAVGIVAHGEEAPTSNLSVGYGLRDSGEFGIEIRLQNPTVSALLHAKNLAAQHGAHGAPIGVVRQLKTHAGPHPASIGNDPLTLGSSVGIPKGLAGTLGGFARDAAGRVGILSCSHILARSGEGRRGDSVFHPSPVDDALASQRIGSLNQFEDMRKSGKRPWDAAFALLEEGPKCGGNTVPKGHSFPREGRALAREVRTPLPPFANVAKIGRATGWTRGQVVAEDFGPLDIWFPALNRNVTVSSLTEIAWAGLDDPFSSGGDSGSLVYLEESLEPIGLVVGGGVVTIDDKRYGRSYACPLAPILDRWKLALL